MTCVLPSASWLKCKGKSNGRFADCMEDHVLWNNSIAVEHKRDVKARIPSGAHAKKPMNVKNRAFYRLALEFKDEIKP